MITFHSQQSDCARHARKNENAGTFNFTPQIAASICTVEFTKLVKSDAIIFTSRCTRLSLIYIFIHGHALLLRQRRILRPRNSRGIDTQRMRHSPQSRTRTRTSRDRELAANWPQTRTGQNCGLALNLARTPTQTRTRPGHKLKLAATTTSPQAGHGRGLDKERPFYLKSIFINTPTFYVRI